jgi:hypothetical protein
MAGTIADQSQERQMLAPPVVTASNYLDFYVALLRLQREDRASLLQHSRVVRSLPSSDGLRTGRTLDSKSTGRRWQL